MEARERRSVITLLVAVFGTSAGMAALTTSLGKQVFDLTGSELALGMLGLAEFLPAALLVFISGPLADRHDRRRIASYAIAGEVVVAIGFAAYAGTDPTSAVPLFVLVVLYGTARAFAFPATRALPADIVAGDRLAWLVARQSITWQGSMILGPVLAGFLYAADVTLPYLAVAALFSVAMVAIRLVHVRPVHLDVLPAPDRGGIDDGSPAGPLVVDSAASDDDARARARAEHPGPAHDERPKPSLREAMEGLRFVRTQPILLGAISLDLFAVLFGGAVALLPAIAEDRLGVGAVGLGWLRAAVGIGAATMTGYLAFRPLRRRVGRVLLVAVAAFGVGTVVLGVTRSFVVAFAALAFLSAADAISVNVRATLVPLVTPRDKRGRVLAVESVFIGASNELGAFESGVVGQLLGPALAIGFGGVATLFVAGIWWFAFPALRDVDGFPTANDP